jgi:hypothetical protein
VLTVAGEALASGREARAYWIRRVQRLDLRRPCVLSNCLIAPAGNRHAASSYD